ncbi:hypothetical protein EMCRGX_G032493 [Ephydatia muelleri]
MAVKLEVLHKYCPGSETVPLQCGDVWSVRKDKATGCTHELFVSGNTVTWFEGIDTANRLVKNLYCVETTALQAYWCQFYEKGNAILRCVCVRESSCLTLFMETGAVHYVPLPFLAHGSWPLDGGIMVERKAASDAGHDGLPTLFTLLHPLDDLCPTTFRRPAATSPDLTVLGFYSDPSFRVLRPFSDPDSPPFVVCYDSSAGRHLVSVLLAATLRDIPSHISTPSHSRIRHTPVRVLSSSDPTPNAHITPVPSIIQCAGPQAHAPRPTPASIKGGCVAVKVGSGRSPFVGRVPTPQSGGPRMRSSKSLSPPHLARISPFSQTVNSQSWSTFYSEESLGQCYEALVPQRCLHLVWQEPGHPDDRPSVVPASAVFLTTDVLGKSYIVFLFSSQVWLLEYAKAQDGSYLCGAILSLPALQAVPLEDLSMILVLQQNSHLGLFTGTHKISDVDMTPLLRGPSGCGIEDSPVSVAQLRDSIDSSFTVVLSTGEMVRCSVPLLHRHPSVSLCLQALKHGLPAEVFLAMVSSYYMASHMLPTSHLLPHFVQWMSSCVPLSGSQPHDSGSRKDCIRPVDLDAVPALRFFVGRAMQHSQAVGHTLHKATPSLGPAFLLCHAGSIVSVLHLVYEELKLSVLLAGDCEFLAQLLHRYTSWLGWSSYRDHYQRDFPSLYLTEYLVDSGESSKEGVSSHILFSHSTPPHIMAWLQKLLSCGKGFVSGVSDPIQLKLEPFPLLLPVTRRTLQLIKVFALYCIPQATVVPLSGLVQWLGPQAISLIEPFNQLQEKVASPYERVILSLAEEEMTLSQLETFPVSLCLPIWDCVAHCQLNPPSSWPSNAYDIIGRNDIARSLSSEATKPALKMEGPHDQDDGMDIDMEVLGCRFPRDLRALEVRRMLQSSKPVRVVVVQKPETSDHEFIEQQETHLLAICQRTMALPVGRGMFTMATTQPLPTAALVLPKLNLTGRAPPRNATIGFDHIEKPSDMQQWPQFHNGVAAGLKIAPCISEMDSTWIVFNRPVLDQACNEYAGFLLALGLNGHLTKLSSFDIYEHLQEKHDLTVVSLLLGISAARAGTMSPPLTSLMALYLPPLLPQGAADMEISRIMQTAAIMGIGFLYSGSGHRRMVEVMLNEIACEPGPDLEQARDRECYALCAGLSLGMIVLGQGRSSVALLDLNIEDRLCTLMNGGLRRQPCATSAASCGQSHLILEGDAVNTHVTSPGAVLALGLMYLKTNDINIAAKFDVPATQFGLDFVRPDFLLLRALSRGLVMWDHVMPTQEWIHRHIPPFILENASGGGGGMAMAPGLDYQSLRQAYLSIVAGCCMAMGLRFVGTCNQAAFQCLLANVKMMLSLLLPSAAEQVGKVTLEMCLTTTLLGLSLVMCGSGDLAVVRIIRRLRTRISSAEVNYGSHMATHMALGLLFLGGGRYSMGRHNRAIASLVCSLYPVFPANSNDNRCHLQALRHLYVMAAEPRVLVARDVRTTQVCAVEVCVTSLQGEVHMATTPCLLPEWETIRRVSISSLKYWPIELEVDAKNRNILSQSGTLFVKQRGGCEVKASLPMTHLYHGCGIKSLLNQANKALIDNPFLKTFLEYMTGPSVSRSPAFRHSVLVECLLREQSQLLVACLQLEQMVCSLWQRQDTLQLWQIKLAVSVCSIASTQCADLLDMGYLESLVLRVIKQIAGASKNKYDEKGIDDLLKLYLFQCGSFSNLRGALHLASLLVFYDIPHSSVLCVTPSTSVPDLLVKARSLNLPMAAVVHLMPLFQAQNPIPF